MSDGLVEMQAEWYRWAKWVHDSRTSDYEALSEASTKEACADELEPFKIELLALLADANAHPDHSGDHSDRYCFTCRLRRTLHGAKEEQR